MKSILTNVLNVARYESVAQIVISPIKECMLLQADVMTYLIMICQ